MRILLFLTVVAGLFYGCSTDFDIIAPYKEVMVVDGLINEWDSVQYVRISKAYLGEGDAYVMAQQKDSINYDTTVLDVKMTELSSGQQFSLFPDQPNNKDSGIFNHPYVLLYTTNHNIDRNSKYRIDITNTSSGLHVYSETKVVGDIHIISPVVGNPVDLSSNFAAPIYVTYNPGINSYVDEVRLRFHYREIDPSGVSTYHYVDWNLGTPANSTSSEIKYQYFKDPFWSNIQANIPDKPGYVRRIDSLETGVKPIEYVFIEGSEDLDTYINLNKPSSGVVIDKPLFTTITNGVGLFTSRLTHLEFFDLKPATIAFMDTCVYLQGKNFEF